MNSELIHIFNYKINNFYIITILFRIRPVKINPSCVCHSVPITHKTLGILGLQEKRGGSKPIYEISQDPRIQRLEAENAYLKKLLDTKRGMKLKRVNQ